MKRTRTLNRLKKSMLRIYTCVDNKNESIILWVTPFDVIFEELHCSKQSVIDRIDPKTPSKDDLILLAEELDQLRRTDIRAVDPSTLVDVKDVIIDTELPLLERTIDYIKKVRNPYCYKIHGVVVKANFTGISSMNECFEEALFGGGTSNPLYD